ncbi:hypothetical protein BU17DRAFT_92792 [Hysterangium stoloniferum]|nr:hypothetical protein BU17DRAFT_92792 [Hysterangium stoloniferum]
MSANSPQFKSNTTSTTPRSRHYFNTHYQQRPRPIVNEILVPTPQASPLRKLTFDEVCRRYSQNYKTLRVELDEGPGRLFVMPESIKRIIQEQNELESILGNMAEVVPPDETLSNIPINDEEDSAGDISESQSDAASTLALEAGHSMTVGRYQSTDGKRRKRITLQTLSEGMEQRAGAFALTNQTQEDSLLRIEEAQMDIDYNIHLDDIDSDEDVDIDSDGEVDSDSNEDKEMNQLNFSHPSSL